MDYFQISVTATGAAVLLAGLRGLKDDPSLTYEEKQFVESMIHELQTGLFELRQVPSEGEVKLH